MDQVMVTPTGQPGLNPEQDVSVPINWAYNHHYMFWLMGAHAELRKVAALPNDPMAHGANHKWIAVDRPSAQMREDVNIPTSSWFSEGNGGESRKSFHGYPDGFAQLVDSPTTWHMNPMQIDTRNRDCGVTPADIGNCTRFTPGPEPRQSRWGRGIPQNTNYSGILECPCNSRFGGDPLIYPKAQTKLISDTFVAVNVASCNDGTIIGSAQACFSAAQSVGIHASNFVNSTVTDPRLPPACSVSVSNDTTAIVYFNTHSSATPCQTDGKLTGVSTTSQVKVTLGIDLDSTKLFERSQSGYYCSDNHKSFLKSFPMASNTLSDAHASLNQCETYCRDEDSCWGCSVDCPRTPLVYGRLFEACQWNAVSSCGETLLWSGSIVGDISKKNLQAGMARITLSGPASVWFGVGLGALRMCDEPYALIVNDTGVTEQKLGTCGDEGCHCGGDRLAQSVTMVSNTVSNGVRTVVLTRQMQGLTKDHFTFAASGNQTIRLITAVGNSLSFGYHRAHAPAVITLTSTLAPTCICDFGSFGSLCETNGQACKQFTKDCKPAPFGDLVTQRNPTCNSKSYVGGLSCCGHKRIMLDADQEIRPELLRYHMKIRFWFQAYERSVQSTGQPSHWDLKRFYYQTESNAGEYDVPPAFALPGEQLLGYESLPANTPTPGTTCTGSCPDGSDCDCVHTITYHWTVSNVSLVYAGGHCHAPSCISIELFRNDTGTLELLCRQLPVFGQGDFPKHKWDEAGYLALPPCLWSENGIDGLEPRPWLPENTPLVSIKKNRNTHQGHLGEMASWQMRGVQFPRLDAFFV
eukprot:TRINITY_DN49359_c0_g1_i1.p1 TRINITY_DN49359_c0_g1~~TRINITY_DN49359_c0_g1_i1.p1  ORF type:complete len:937 (-),score=98.26 TRINITY_DN49359_c0_g1_i1:92-2509(-)